jgi:TrmH family RNA methyltransferase
MIAPSRFSKLNPKHRMRKAAAFVLESERSLASGGAVDAPSLATLVRALAEGADLPESVRLCAAAALDGDQARGLNRLRHALLSEVGVPQADWDFLDPRGRLDRGRRSALPGTALYLEDIRSPFNVGTIFRSAEAFGIERLVLSPDCADPGHPRAERSAMGCVDALAWERRELKPGRDLENCFALELGGTPLDEFEFPDQGTCILGSEELGVRPETLAACGLGRVSIPMSGAKASVNVAVACGIVLCAWRSRLAR